MTDYEKSLLSDCIKHLIDTMEMFEQIEHNRQLPPFAQTQSQYVSKGREIKRFLLSNHLIQSTEPYP